MNYGREMMLFRTGDYITNFACGCQMSQLNVVEQPSFACTLPMHGGGLWEVRYKVRPSPMLPRFISFWQAVEPGKNINGTCMNGLVAMTTTFHCHMVNGEAV